MCCLQTNDDCRELLVVKHKQPKRSCQVFISSLPPGAYYVLDFNLISTFCLPFFFLMKWKSYLQHYIHAVEDIKACHVFDVYLVFSVFESMAAAAASPPTALLLLPLLLLLLLLHFHVRLPSQDLCAAFHNIISHTIDHSGTVCQLAILRLILVSSRI